MVSTASTLCITRTKFNNSGPPSWVLSPVKSLESFRFFPNSKSKLKSTSIKSAKWLPAWSTWETSPTSWISSQPIKRRLKATSQNWWSSSTLKTKKPSISKNNWSLSSIRARTRKRGFWLLLTLSNHKWTETSKRSFKHLMRTQSSSHQCSSGARSSRATRSRLWAR